LNLGNTKTTYGPLARALHWWMAALIIGLVGLGLYMTDQPDGDPKWALYDLHKSLGVVAFTLDRMVVLVVGRSKLLNTARVLIALLMAVIGGFDTATITSRSPAPTTG